jgi:Ni,Fe-hydrogenase III component G
METNEVLDQIQDLLKEFIETANHPEENRLDIWVKPEDFKSVIKIIVDERWGYLMTITGMDISPVVDQENVETTPGFLEALYHFANEADVLTIRVKVPYTNPQIETICDLIPSATIYEREAMELFGFDLVNTPSRDRLVLPDCWPEGVYPLRKSFTALPQEEILKKESSNE